MNKEWYPNVPIKLRTHDPFMWQATLYCGRNKNGKNVVQHFYGWTKEEVEQDLRDAFELLGEERLTRRRHKVQP